MSATPKYGRNARLVLASVLVGYARNIKTSAKAAGIDVHSMESMKPALSEPGNISFDWSCDKLAVDNTLLTKLLAGTKFTIIFTHSGSPPTAPYETWTGCYITGWDKSAGMDDGILESVSGKALDVTPTAS